MSVTNMKVKDQLDGVSNFFAMEGNNLSDLQGASLVGSHVQPPSSSNAGFREHLDTNSSRPCCAKSVGS